MESCRSSDSETGVVVDSTRGSGTSGSSPSSPTSDSNLVVVMADSLAEKEAELLKVKMECKRLQEANASLSAKLRLHPGSSSSSHRGAGGGVPATDLEKEVDHLR